MDNNNNLTLEQQLEQLRAENEKLKANQKAKPTEGGLRVSDKRAISLYGLGRFPVTLHRKQWIAMFAAFGIPVPEKMQAFLDKHKAILDQAQIDREARVKASTK